MANNNKKFILHHHTVLLLQHERDRFQHKLNICNNNATLSELNKNSNESDDAPMVNHFSIVAYHLGTGCL